MREILFRGKRVDNGEWVYGFLSKSRNIEEKPALLKPCIDYEEKGVMMSSIVDPETVGQYTGLTDKNGVKIFEGDICKFSYSVINGYCTGVVNYFLGSFVVDSDFENLEFSLEQLVIEDEEFNVEVIANIHDNPELLEAERNDENG